MKEAIAKSIYYSSSSSYSIITTFTYNDPYEFASLMQDLKNNLALRNFFGYSSSGYSSSGCGSASSEKNIVYDICQNIDYSNLLMEQLGGLYIVTRRDEAIKFVKSDSTSDNYGIIKIDTVIAELSELVPKKTNRVMYYLSYPLLLILGAGLYYEYLSLKND